MPGNVSEKDWRLFRNRLPDWQESFMEKLIGEYTKLLNGEQQASEKFWALEKRIKQDRRNPGVLMRDLRRSNMDLQLLGLLQYGVIQQEDLEGFSTELRERLAYVMERG